MNMTRAVLVGTLATLGVAFAADSTYKSAKYGFSFSYPSTWENIKLVKEPVVVGFRETKPTGNFASNVNVVVIPIEGVESIRTSDLKAVGDATLKEVSGAIENFKLVKRENTTLGGQPAAAYVYSGKWPNMDVQWYQIQTVYKEKGYTLTFTTSKKKYASVEKLFKTIKNSFKLL